MNLSSLYDLALSSYFVVLIIGFLASSLFLFKPATRIKGRTILFTAILYLPTTVLIGALSTLVLYIPEYLLVAIFSYFKLGIAIKSVTFGVMGLVIGFALYHWYLVYRLVYNRENNLDLEHGIRNDRVYKVFLKQILNYYRTKYLKDEQS